MNQRSKNCPRISQPLKSHISRTCQSVAVISAASGELANPFSSASRSLGLQSERRGGVATAQVFEVFKRTHTHTHDWTDQTAHSQVGLRVCVHACRRVLPCRRTHVCAGVNTCVCMRLLYVYVHPLEHAFCVRLRRHFPAPGPALIRTRSSQDLNT